MSWSSSTPRTERTRLYSACRGPQTTGVRLARSRRCTTTGCITARLADELRARGWEVQDVFAEDWGWVVALHRDGTRLFVNCGNEDGSLTRWSVQPRAHARLLRSLLSRGSDSQAALGALDRDLEAVIEADEKTTWHGREQPA